MTLLTSVCVPRPLFGKVQPEVEQGMIVARDVPHEDADLAVVDLAPVATPLALHPDRMRPALGKAARIKGDNPIGFPQPLDHLSHQYRDQRPVVPERGPDEGLHDQALNIDEGGNLLSILAMHLRQETGQVEGEVTL